MAFFPSILNWFHFGRQTRFLQLLFISLVGLLYVGTALPAAAADECGVLANPNNGATDTIACGTASPYTGISYPNLQDPTSVSIVNTIVTTNGVLLTGTTADSTIDVVIEEIGAGPTPSITNSANGNGALSVTTTAGAAISIDLRDGTLSGTASAGEGIFASVTGGGGGISVTTAAGTEVISTQDDGIDLATEGGGTITIDVAGNVTAGNNQGDVGIGAIGLTGGGSIDITVQSTSTVLSSGNGIEAQTSGSGTIDITVDGTLESKAGDIGTQASPSNSENGLYTNHTGSGKTTINVGESGSIISGTGADDHGILAINTSTGDIEINHAGTITTGSADGIHVEIGSGTATVNVEAGGTIASTGNGVRVIGDGTVIVNVDGSVGEDGSAVGGVGVYVSGAGSGSATVNKSGNLLSIHAEDDGIRISNKASADIDNDGGVIDSGDDGIDIDNIGGPVDIHNWGGSIAGAWEGIDATNIEGTVVIHNSFGGWITGYGDAIALDDIDDDVTIYNFAGDIWGGDEGIRITDVWNGNVAIHNSFGNITGDDSEGITIEEVDGNVTINNALFGDIWGYWDGIQIEEVEGRVTILNSFGGEIEGEEGDGIDIADIDDDVTIYNRFGGRITGEHDGIAIDDVWHGDVTIYNDGGSIRGWHGNGIVVTDIDGAVYVENGDGSIRGAEHAISIEAEWVEIDSDGLIRGAGSEEYPTIRLATEDGAVIDNDEDGLIRGDAYSSTDLIVKASGGAVEINNRGEMFGRIDLTDAGTTGYGNVVNNISADSWTFTGTSEFGAGLADALNNTGTVHTTNPDDAEVADTTIFAGLESFTNGEEGDGGGSGTIDMQDGFTGDVTILRPTEYGELIFHGVEGRSFVSLDAFLQGPSAEDNSADLLVIEGMATGRTQLNVVNINTEPAFLDLEGVKVVQANASSGDGSEFFLAAPVEAGLFDYGLFFDDTGETDDWYLRGDVNGSGQALGSLHTGITSLFTAGAGPWTERTTDLHEIVAGHGPVSAPMTGPSPGIWGTAFGGARSHEATFTTLVDTYDASYRQRALGFLGGIDTVVDSDGEGTLLAGVVGGYVSSSLAFATEGAGGTMHGASVGGYLTYLHGGLFADLLVKADFLSVEFTAGGSTANSTGRAIGALAEIGYRMDSGEMFVEPIATLAYVNISTSGFTLLGTDIRFPNSNNLVGRIGARAGTSAASNGAARVDTFVSASVWDNFSGGNAATIVGGGGGAVAVVDGGTGLYFEVGAGVEVTSLVNGVSGFLRGDYQFGDSISGGSGRGGVRVNW